VAEAADFEAAGLLDGLEGAGREARLRLLRALDDAGLELDQLREAHAEGLMVFQLAELEVTGPQTLSQREVAERSGLELDLLQRLRRSQGLPTPDPDARVFGEGDVELSATLKGLRDAGVPEERLLDIGRLLGRGLQPVAEAMRATALEQSFDPSLAEDELAERFRQRAAVLLPFIAPTLVGTMRLHLREMLAQEATTVIERRSGSLAGARPVVVAFADLSGFTRLGEQLDPGSLGAVAARLGHVLHDCVREGVRVVKELGDGAMLVAPDAPALVATALDLVDAAQADEELPALRVGIAAGEALPRGGDWFGRPVNVASRVCDAARPSSVLATREVRDAARDGVRWSSTGPKTLKGVDTSVRLFRARRAGDGDG
jgi:adenylate cyclase